MEQNNENLHGNEEVIVMKEKKRGGCGTYVGGVFSGILLTVLFLVGGFVFILFHVNIKAIESSFGVEVPFIRGNYETMPLKDLIKELTSQADQIKNYTLATLGEEKNLIDLPATIPGTDIKLTGVYECEIEFNGRTDKVKNFAVYNEIYKNFDAFVDEFIGAIYKTNTVGDLLKTFNINLDSDLNYPAFTQNLYTVEGGTQKSFRNLTIAEALDVLPEYYSSDKLTMQGIVDAIGIDLSDYRFAQTEDFLSQTIESITDYMTTVPLNQFVQVKASINDCENLTDKALFLMSKLTYDDLTSDDVASKLKDELELIGMENYTLGELVGLKDDSANALKRVGTIKLYDLIGGDVEKSIIDSLTKELDENNIEHDVTLGELLGFTGEDNLSDMIKEVKILDLIGENAKPDKAIKNALCKEGNTLGKLFNYESDEGVLGMLKGVELSSLIGDGANAETAIKQALCAEGNTLGKLFDIRDEKGIAKLMAKIEINDLLGEEANITQAIKRALSKDEDGNDVTIGYVFEIDTENPSTSAVVKKLASIKMGDLLGQNEGVTAEQTLDDFVNSLTIKEIFSAETIESSMILKALSTYEDETTGEIVDTPLNKIPNRVDNLTLREVLGEAPESGLISLIANYNTVKIKNLAKPVSEGGITLKPLTVENIYKAELISNLISRDVGGETKYYIVYDNSGSNVEVEIAGNTTLEGIFEFYARYSSYLGS